MHIFGPLWKDTLSDAQKLKIDEMHLELKKSVSILKANLKVKKVELSNLVIANDVDKKR